MNTININFSGTSSPFTARVQELGRITIPEEIRKLWKIKKGDTVGCWLWKITSGTIVKEVEGE